MLNSIPAAVSESRQSTILSPPQGFFDGRYQKEIKQETERRARIMQRTGQPLKKSLANKIFGYLAGWEILEKLMYIES